MDTVTDRQTSHTRWILSQRIIANPRQTRHKERDKSNSTQLALQVLLESKGVVLEGEEEGWLAGERERDREREIETETETDSDSCTLTAQAANILPS